MSSNLPISNTSLFSNTQGVNTHGGQHNAAGRDIHMHFYNTSGHDGGGGAHEDTNTVSGHPGTAVSSSPFPFRFPDVSRIFRTRSLDIEVINIVEAEYSSLLIRSSSAAPMISEVYQRLMLKHRNGYPLYHPEPRRSHSIEYQRKGVRVGDVGRITPDGAFDFLFSIDSSQANLVNPPILPRDFEKVPSIEVLPQDYFQSSQHLLSDHVHQTRDMPITYGFSASEGSVLQLPEGAALFEAVTTNELYDLATRHALNWYDYMFSRRSRDIPNGSLYLVTGCIKTRNWGIGVIHGRTSERDYLEFISEDRQAHGAYRWRRSGPITTKIGPTPTDIVTMDSEEPNQCVFLRGYKIALGKKLWKKARKTVSVGSKEGAHSTSQPSSVPSYGQHGSMGKQSASRSRSDNPKGSSSVHTHSEIIEASEVHGQLDQYFDDLYISDQSDETVSNSTLVEAVISESSSLHPSDIIISMLSHIEPEAEVILVHDNEWCSFLPEGFMMDTWNPKVRGLLENIKGSCVAAVDHNACVSLVRSPLDGAKRTPRDSLQLYHINEITSPTLPNSPDSIITVSDPGFPTEILEEILSHLDFPSKMRYRVVCSAFRKLIDSSPYFHWQRELAISGMEDGGNYPLAIRRQMLERHQQGWTNLQWTSEQRKKYMDGMTWARANLLAQSDPTHTVIYFDQLASPSRNIEGRSWTMDVKATKLDRFDMDPSQDLLIVVGKPFEQEDQYIHRIFVWALSTGDRHPLADGNHILTHASTRPQWTQRRGRAICGENLCVVFSHVTEMETEIKLWNWRTGQVVMNLVGNRLRGATFLSERHLMFANEWQEPRLVVVDFAIQPREKKMVSDLTNAYTFGFPPLAGTVEVAYIDILSAPNPNWEPNPALRAPFFASHHNRLFVINLAINDGSDNEPEVVIISRESTFLSLIEGTNLSLTHFDWPTWGPDGTRTMVSISRDVLYDAYGMKFASTFRLSGQATNYLHVYDFNQLALKWSKSNGDGAAAPTDNNEVGSTPKGLSEDSLPYTNITEPTRIPAGNIFQDEIETRLGYRAKRWAIPGQPAVQGPEFCGEDGIILNYGRDGIEEFHILTL